MQQQHQIHFKNNKNTQVHNKTHNKNIGIQFQGAVVIWRC